ncbi:permease prefix domain 1-containing protein [Actinomadura sp. 3N407]|uniref:permease prefix domain 1-containing protein n=1 Tax=Actinomadura sp. 3N407 TaxID=3457423 RepID=UPI003FCCF9EF
MTATGDVVEDYVASLAANLHGPARVKGRMVEEIRDGLRDTVEAHAVGGMPYDRAAHQAVREFGTGAELLPHCQRELTIAQTRHTARTAALTVPFLIGCWLLIWTADLDREWPSRLLTVHLAGVAATAGLLAATTLAATGPLALRVPTPRRLPLAVAWTGTTAGAAMGIAALALVAASILAAHWPLMVLAGALTAASHAMVASSARACRRCARLLPPHGAGQA